MIMVVGSFGQRKGRGVWKFENQPVRKNLQGPNSYFYEDNDTDR